MGIPKFASWLMKKHPKMVLKGKRAPTAIAGLYVDMNGVIHPCCHSEDDPSLAASTTQQKIERICLALDDLVFETQPTHILYLAMDGVAPQAKMNQQRARRYSAAQAKYGITKVFMKKPEVTPAEKKSPEKEPSDEEEEDLFTADELRATEEELKRARQEIDMGIYGPPKTPPIIEDMGSAQRSQPSMDFLGELDYEPFMCDSPVKNPDNNEKKKPAIPGSVTSDTQPSGSFDSNCISPGTLFMENVARALEGYVRRQLANPEAKHWHQNLAVILSDSNSPGEGEHKIIDFMRCQCTSKEWPRVGAHVVVGLDADLILLCLSLHMENIYILRDNERGRVAQILQGEGETSPLPSPSGSDDEAEAAERGEQQQASPATSPQMVMPRRRKKLEFYDIGKCADAIVSEIVTIAFHIRNHEAARRAALNPQRVLDDFVAMASLMGNDFLPRLPSAFCGDFAMDNILEAYIWTVLPEGFIADANTGDINLLLLMKLLRQYAAVEALLFRQFLVKSNEITAVEAAAPVDAPVDLIWKKRYCESTTYSTNPEVQRKACEKFVEGLRFVWRYYATSSQECSWLWYYPFHHGPLTTDLATYLESVTKTRSDWPSPPEVQVRAPSPFLQLLCILPPTSCRLLPQPFWDLLCSPPPNLRETFPLEWQVDHAGSGGKDHLTTILIPFANMSGLAVEIESRLQKLTSSEQQRNTNNEQELLFLSMQHQKAVRSRELFEKQQALEVDAAGTAQVVGPFRGGDKHPTVHFVGILVDTWVMPSTITSPPTAQPSDEILRGTFRLAIRSTARKDSDRRPIVINESINNIPSVSNSFFGALKLNAKQDGSLAVRGQNVAEGGTKGSAVVKAKPIQPKVLTTSRFLGISFPDFTVSLFVGIGLSLVFFSIALPSSSAFSLLQFGPELVTMTLTSIILLWALGFIPLPDMPRCNLIRNGVRDSNIDWICPSCNSLNFGKQFSCFQCYHLFNHRTTKAVFSNRFPATPPVMDPNHKPCLERVGLDLPHELEEQLKNLH